MSQEGESKVRRDHDPWHDAAVPLKSDDGSRRSPSEEVRHSITFGKERFR